MTGCSISLGHTLDIGGGSAVEKGPWHYGADYIAVFLRADRSKLARYLPRGLEVGDGTCVAYVCEITSVSEGRSSDVAERPESTLYHEGAFGIGCSFEGSGGVFYPVMWVDTEFSLLRGLLNGFPKRLADSIHISRYHPLNRGLQPFGKGVKLSGYCVKGGRRVLSVSVEIEKRGRPEDLVRFGNTYGMRVFSPTHPSQKGVAELVEVVKSGQRTSDVWLGSGSFEVEMEIGKSEPLFGSFYMSGFTIGGARVLRYFSG